MGSWGMITSFNRTKESNGFSHYTRIVVSWGIDQLSINHKFLTRYYETTVYLTVDGLA